MFFVSAAFVLLVEPTTTQTLKKYLSFRNDVRSGPPFEAFECVIVIDEIGGKIIVFNTQLKKSIIFVSLSSKHDLIYEISRLISAYVRVQSCQLPNWGICQNRTFFQDSFVNEQLN